MSSNRVRGFAEWNPYKKSQVLLDQVIAVLDEYQQQLPLTARQIFYRLVGTVDYPKTENAYERLLELLNRARRAHRISMDCIRDDGSKDVGLTRYESPQDYIQCLKEDAEDFQYDLQQHQPRYIEVICEAQGMVPQMNRVARAYGIPVRSSGGFNSTTVKHQLGEFYGSIRKPVVVLHVGDFDPSGEHIHMNLQEDVGAFADHYLGSVTVQRVAVTPLQQKMFDLPTDKPKKTDAREFPYDFTVQAEALKPSVLAALLRQAIEENTNMEAWKKAKEKQDELRDQLVKLLSELPVSDPDLDGTDGIPVL